MDPYSLIAQYPNAGEGFASAFNQGMQQNALSRFAMNPNDPNAQAAAARYDPGAVMQARQQQHQLQAQQHQQWVSFAGNLAKMADTPEKFDQAIDYVLSHDHPEVSTQELMQLKSLTPEQKMMARSSFMAAAGLQDDKPAQDPGIIREYDIALQRQMIPPGTTYEQYITMRNPGAQTPVIIPNNVQQVGGGQGGGLPRVSDQSSYDAVPAGGQYVDPQGNVRTKGGQTGGGSSGGFPQ